MLYDYDALDKDDEIGEAKLAVADLRNQEEKDVWLNIEEMTPDGPSQHKVSLVRDMWYGSLRAPRASLLQCKCIKSRTNRRIRLNMPAFGQVLLQYEAGAYQSDWIWEVQTCCHRPHTACYYSCCNASERQELQSMAPVCAHSVCAWREFLSNACRVRLESSRCSRTRQARASTK